MIDAVPSHTAQRVAERRAAHQVLDRPIVFDDPLAVRIAGLTDAQILASEARERHRLSTRLRAFLVARSLFAEEHLAAAFRAGVRQYVILGAGLDTFAYRHALAPSLRVFEVDFPATQAWKRERLSAVGIAAPETLTYVAVDFEQQTAFDGLAASGFDRNAPAFFSWLGVTMYLSEPVVMAVLRAVAALPAPSGIVFDYFVDPSSFPEPVRLAALELGKRAASVGEPWTLAFEPPRLVEHVKALGFTTVEDVGREELDQRYFSNRSDDLRVGTIGRLLYAAL